MTELIVTIHLIFFAIALGGRILFIPILRTLHRNDLNDRLEGIIDSLKFTKWADAALLCSMITGITLIWLKGQPLIDLHWALKLKLIFVFLLIVDLAAFYLAQVRIQNYYDKHMIPVISRLNGLAVLLMCCMVFFASFTMT
jgi:hypothetical protein